MGSEGLVNRAAWRPVAIKVVSLLPEDSGFERTISVPVDLRYESGRQASDKAMVELAIEIGVDQEFIGLKAIPADGDVSNPIDNSVVIVVCSKAGRLPERVVEPNVRLVSCRIGHCAEQVPGCASASDESNASDSD